MGKKFRLRITTLIMASIILVGSSMMASAATKGACNHPNRIDKFRVIDHWSGFHMVLLQSSQGEVRCDYGHEVVEMTNICKDCGTVFRLDHIHHERHTVCGINY